MGVYKCSIDESCKIALTVDSENDIKVTVYDEVFYNNLYLSRKDAQKLANELNQLLMEGKGNE